MKTVVLLGSKGTNNVMSHLMSQQDTLPAVGRFFVETGYTDRYSYPILSVSNDLKTMVIDKGASWKHDVEGYATEYTASNFHLTLKFKWGGWRAYSEITEKWEQIKGFVSVTQQEYRDPCF
jgi:hypothetical protein